MTKAGNTSLVEDAAKGSAFTWMHTGGRNDLMQRSLAADAMSVSARAAERCNVFREVTYPHIVKANDEPARLERVPRVRVSQIVMDYLVHGWSADEV